MRCSSISRGCGLRDAPSQRTRIDGAPQHFVPLRKGATIGHGQPEAHEETVAAGVSKFAYNARIITFPELPEKGDVSDFLETHNACELHECALKAPQWKPAEALSTQGEADRCPQEEML